MDVMLVAELFDASVSNDTVVTLVMFVTLPNELPATVTVKFVAVLAARVNAPQVTKRILGVALVTPPLLALAKVTFVESKLSVAATPVAMPGPLLLNVSV
jgi:hypothetical protein